MRARLREKRELERYLCCLIDLFNITVCNQLGMVGVKNRKSFLNIVK